MPDGTLTICFEIKIFPSLATVSHRIVQEDVAPTNPAPAAFPAAAVAPSRKNFFEGMVDNFVDLKLSSVLIVFKDGEQKCHAFPLAARKSPLVENIFSNSHRFQVIAGVDPTLFWYRYWYLHVHTVYYLKIPILK
jgi:hypothetical protein